MAAKHVREFLTFIREQGVMGLVIGFMLGGAAQKLVSAFVNDIINPLLGIVLVRADELQNAKVVIRGAEILWGDFVKVLIDFVLIALIVYYGFKKLGLEKVDKKLPAK